MLSRDSKLVHRQICTSTRVVGMKSKTEGARGMGEGVAPDQVLYLLYGQVGGRLPLGSHALHRLYVGLFF